MRVTGRFLSLTDIFLINEKQVTDPVFFQIYLKGARGVPPFGGGAGTAPIQFYAHERAAARTQRGDCV